MRLPWSRRGELRRQSGLQRGDRVVYRGAERNGLVNGSAGVIVSDVPGRMDVRPFATPPTVPEAEDVDHSVDVDFHGLGARRVSLRDVVRRHGG